jgi:response regulator RpfG family c-di-GMP phosphodiesterase
VNALPRVLCVDDEPLVLEGLERVLSESFDVTTEAKSLAAVDLLSTGRHDFDVIISDMRMPLLNGAKFLARAATLAPEAARILLTGFAELQSAIDAVNDGRIFRFLCKPCPPDELVAAVEAGIEQRRLRNVERELLEETLTGSVRLLSDVLALVSPSVFSRTQRIQAYVVHMAQRMGRSDVWRFELAASLLMIGCVGLPEETLQRALAGTPLDPQEKQAFEEQPFIAYRLLSKIPRFEAIAEMIRLQHAAWSPSEVSPDIALGARLLAVARTIDRLVHAGDSEPDAIAKALPTLGIVERRLLKTLEDFRSVLTHSVLRDLRVSDMTPQMMLEQDVKTRQGVVVVPAGRALTQLLIERLRRFSIAGNLEEPVRVRIPA